MPAAQQPWQQFRLNTIYQVKNDHGTNFDLSLSWGRYRNVRAPTTSSYADLAAALHGRSILPGSVAKA
jgi:hypothetical protein